LLEGTVDLKEALNAVTKRVHEREKELEEQEKKFQGLMV
jgi:hypothetical protein